MRKTAALAIAMIMSITPAWAADLPIYKVIPEKSFLKFFAIQNGAPVQGRFEKFSADIKFDPAQADKSSIMVEVETGSLTASNDDVVKNLKLPEWLATELFPKAVYTSKKISRMPMTDNYY